MNVKFLARPQEELAQAIDFYEQQLPGLGRLFAKEVFETIELIRLYPYGWRRITRLTHRCPLRKFPYMILYGLIDDMIIISAIAHQHQHPSSYLGRDKLY